MTDKKRKRIVYAIFVIAVIWGLFNFPFGRKSEQYVYSEDNAYETGNEIGLVLAGTSDDPSRLDLSSGWGEDPFAQKTANVRAVPVISQAFNLSAVSKSGDNFWALIDGKAMTIGDEINGWTLTGISPSSARLQKDGKTITLNIEGN